MFWSTVGQHPYFWTCKEAEHHGMRSEWSKAVIDFVVVRRERRKMVVQGDVEGSPSMTFKSTHLMTYFYLLYSTHKISTSF